LAQNKKIYTGWSKKTHPNIIIPNDLEMGDIPNQFSKKLFLRTFSQRKKKLFSPGNSFKPF
jgi:hypothetical protein